MAWTYKYLSPAVIAKIKADAIKVAVPFVFDAALLRAWEADLAAHEALRDSKTTAAGKKPYEDAIKVLEKALADAPVIP